MQQLCIKAPAAVDTTQKVVKCNLCDVRVTGEASLEEHMKGKNHQMMARRVKENDGLDMISDKSQSVSVCQSQSLKTEEQAVVAKFKCEICDVELTSEVDLTNHQGGKKHQSKLANNAKDAASSFSQREGEFNCQLCRISLTGEESLRAHMAGKKHQAKQASPNPGSSETTRATNAFHCSLCDLTLSGPVDMEKHNAGKSHRAKLLQENDDPSRHSQASKTLECAICNVKFSGNSDLVAHMSGKKHKAKLGATKC